MKPSDTLLSDDAEGGIYHVFMFMFHFHVKDRKKNFLMMYKLTNTNVEFLIDLILTCRDIMYSELSTGLQCKLQTISIFLPTFLSLSSVDGLLMHRKRLSSLLA